MKKIICMLFLIQGGLMMAQTETVVTVNGKKVQINPNSLSAADNGLTVNSGKVQLGGALLKPTSLVTTASNTLALEGLQTGAAADNILVIDTNGVVKMISTASLGAGGDNLGDHTATEDLNMTSHNINAANTVTAVNANVTTKTTTQTMAVTKGTDGSLPMAGYIATAADASGNIKWLKPSNYVDGLGTPKLYVFAYSANGFYSPTGGVFDTVKLDIENALDKGGNDKWKYTTPKDGLYQININISTKYTYNSSGYVYNLQLLKNGNNVIGGISYPTAVVAGGTLTTTIYLKAGDSVSCNAESAMPGGFQLFVYRYE